MCEFILILELFHSEFHFAKLNENIKRINKEYIGILLHQFGMISIRQKRVGEEQNRCLAAHLSQPVD